ncbi:MAG: bifunctional folylpolyglutamate synthase/dihydrofolate synthase [Phocaeicola sp.]
MNYQETLEYLFQSTPLFQHVGKDAYKEGLSNTHLLDAHFNHPHRKFQTIHVAGTNGKGSCSHTLAAIFQAAGYKTGLYTSPHLIDFRERIRINGTVVPEEFVVDFVAQHRPFFEPIHCSFFELTTAMAFHYFAQQEVDIAIIEVGLGGRLDCTNIIHPRLSIITNISLDHTLLLGNSLEQIAAEKAGVIKAGVPVVIGETTCETKPLFSNQAAVVGAPIIFAEEEHRLIGTSHLSGGIPIYQTTDYPKLIGELGGLYQQKNTQTLLSAIHQLKQMGFNLSEEAVRSGFSTVCERTGLMGRWQKLGSQPTIICDTGHNVAGISYIVEQLRQQTYQHLHVVMGMVNDKDIESVLKMMPKEASYYFTQANIPRALPANELKQLAESHGLKGDCYADVATAYLKAKKNAQTDDLLFIGGSSFIVADLLKYCSPEG